MDKIEAIREKIGECDDIIIEQLAVRMSYIQEIISYKKATGIPILQPEQEKKQTDALKNKLGDNEFEEEILDIFKYIMKNSRRIQAKSLFDYNIFLIGFMGAGKSTIAGELKDKLEMDRVEMDQMIVEKQGMSISEIFDEYGEAYFRNLESNTLIELQEKKTDDRFLWWWCRHERRKHRSHEKEWTCRITHRKTGNYLRACQRQRRAPDLKQ